MIPWKPDQLRISNKSKNMLSEKKCESFPPSEKIKKFDALGFELRATQF